MFSPLHASHHTAASGYTRSPIGYNYLKMSGLKDYILLFMNVCMKAIIFLSKYFWKTTGRWPQEGDWPYVAYYLVARVLLNRLFSYVLKYSNFVCFFQEKIQELFEEVSCSSSSLSTGSSLHAMTEKAICTSCGTEIVDKYLLKVRIKYFTFITNLSDEWSVHN